MPLLTPINTDFSRSIGTLMGQASDDISGLGKVATDYLNRKTAEEDKAYQRGREKVIDDRATVDWNQKQKAIQDAKNESAAMAEFSKANPYVDPQTVQVQQGPILPQGQAQTADGQGNLLGGGTPGRFVTTKGTAGRMVPGETIPGHYTDTNPQVLFNQAVPGKAANKAEALADYTKALGGIDKQYDMKLSELKNGMQGLGIKASMTHSEQDQAAYNAASQQYNALLSQKDAAIKGLEGAPKIVNKLRSTNLGDIDQTRVYNHDGTEILSGKAPTSKDQYMRTKQDGLLVNLKDIGKSVQNSYVPEAKTEAAWRAGTPDNVRYIAGTSAKTLPTSSIGENGKAGSVATKDVVATVNQAATTFSGILNNGKPTTADQVTATANKMRDFVMQKYPDLDYMHVSKMALEAAKMQIPDGSMTAKETAAMNAASKDLERSQTVSDTKQKHGWEVEAAAKLQEGENGRFFAGLKSRENIAKQEHDDRILEKTAKFIPVKVYKEIGGKMVVDTANTPADLQNFAKQGYKSGELKEMPGAGLAGSGSSKIDLQALGGRSNILGTSGSDLVALSKRMKNEFKRLPQETIDAEIQNLSQGWISDGVNIGDLRKNLQGYK